MVGVLPIRIVWSNVSSIGPSSEHWPFLRNCKDSIYSVPCNECNKEYIDQTFSENDNLHGEIIKLLPSFRSSIKDVVWRLGMSIGYMSPSNRNNGGILPEANFGQ